MAAGVVGDAGQDAGHADELHQGGEPCIGSMACMRVGRGLGGQHEVGRERERHQRQAQVDQPGHPLELIERTRGRIWMKEIERSDLDTYKLSHQLISTRLFAGRTVIHVLSDKDPGDGFTAVNGDLEDVYFSTMAGRISRRGEQPELAVQ